MAPHSIPLNQAYADHMKNHPFGTALFTPPAYRLFHPGSVGYFDNTGAWNPIADLSPALDPLSSPGPKLPSYTPVAEQLERAPSETAIHWGPKVSSKTKACRVALEAGMSAAVAAAVPIDVRVYYRFTSEHEGGAILLTKSPLRHERYYHQQPFKAWVAANTATLLKTRAEIIENGLWIVTSTWSTDECAINVWQQAGQGVAVGFTTSVVGVGELAPSGEWHQAEQDVDWQTVKAEETDNGRVVFFGGLLYRYSRIPFGQRLLPRASAPIFRGGSGDGSKPSVAETLASTERIATPEGVFQVDCEAVLEACVSN